MLASLIQPPTSQSPASLSTQSLTAVLPEMQIDNVFLSGERTALEIKAAIDAVSSHFQPIGHCSTKIRLGKLEKHHTLYFDEDEELENNEDEELEDNEDEDAGKEKDTGEATSLGTKSNEALVEQLAELSKASPAHASGSLEVPFHLTITRPGCEYDSDVQVSDEFFEENSESEGWLRTLYDKAAVAGYGDVQSQQTKIDPSVRNAREIPASEFSVPPALLDSIRHIWGVHFQPREVRVEPYKIHLYGPTGCFKAHRDTPETGLVGTFLLGLGDSTGDLHLELGVRHTVPLPDPSVYQNPAIDREHTAFPAYPGQWVAFYPDVPHRVTEVRDGYRAVLAFKVFREGDAGAESAQTSALLERVQDVTDQLKAPFGLFLERKYCLGTQLLSGFDALVYKALTQRQGCTVHLLPVVTKWSAIIDRADGRSPSEVESYAAPVYPFTAAHIDALAYGFRLGFNKADRVDDPATLDKGMAWLKRLNKNVEFFATDLVGSTVTWSSQEQDEIEHTGNESRPYSEDSIYLSYALVIVNDE